MKRRTLIIGAAGLASLGASGWLAYRETARKAPQANAQALRVPNALDPALFLDASYPDKSQNMVAMRSLLGQPLVVNFWATWCAPCVREMPLLDQMATEMPQVRVVGVAIDTAANVTSFLEKVPVSFPIFVAGHAGIDVTRALGNDIMALPFTALFAANGQLVSSVLGEVDPQALKADLLRLLAG